MVHYLIHVRDVVYYPVYLGDVDGSVEAILDAFNSYTSDQCQLTILQYGVGAISEQDVEMAANFGGTLHYSLHFQTGYNL